VIELG